jgi:preprotein translocase subunit SecF
MTSFTTLISLFILYFFGGPVMQNFSLPIIVGIIAGTYSSIFLAAPMWSIFYKR